MSELSEFLRNISSFINYPEDAAFYPGISLAKADFYYAGNGDNVICRTCNVKLGNWKNTDNIDVRHKYANPACPKVKLVNISNSISLIYTASSRIAHNYITYKQRLESFKGYEQYFKSNEFIEMIADAGLYCASNIFNRDLVRCYTCNLGLHTFLDKDIPLEEHKKFVKERNMVCPFLIYLEH